MPFRLLLSTCKEFGTNTLLLHGLNIMDLGGFLWMVTLHSCCLPGVGSVFWGWIHNGPSASDDGVHQHPRNILKSSTEVQDTRRTHRHHHGQELCLDDKSCGRGMFCDHHYKTCDFLRKEGEFCRRDSHCEKGLECVFGKCRRIVKKGETGARCRLPSDCAPTMCCARHHGESVCRHRLPLGHKCFVPTGGLDYSLNEQCPCEEGLLCKYIPGGKSKQHGPRPQSWIDPEYVRCSAM